MNLTINPRTIIQEVGEWASRQPWGESSGNPRHAPDFGVVEEVGELMHGILKNYQGIRGFDDVDVFRNHTIDALGDAMVYLSHWCYMKGAYYSIFDDPIVTDLRNELSQLLVATSQLVNQSYDMNVMQNADAVITASRIAKRLQHIAILHNLDLMQCLIITWDKVKRRDWNKDKLSGAHVSTSVLHPEDRGECAD